MEAEAARGGRVARNRQRRSDEFLRAGLRIVTEEGFEALTMSRLANELDTAVGSVYHYFPSKGHLVTAIQAGAIERLAASLDRSIGPVADAVAEATGTSPRWSGWSWWAAGSVRPPRCCPRRCGCSR